MPTIHVVSEDFASNVTVTESSDIVVAHQTAITTSLAHDTDFVLILVDGMPMLKIEDGKEVRL